MNKIFAALAAITVFAGATLPVSAAVTKTASATLKCPSCGMPMPTKKSAAFPEGIKVNGKTYYCCAACPSGKKAAAYIKSHKGAMMAINTGKAKM